MFYSTRLHGWLRRIEGWVKTVFSSLYYTLIKKKSFIKFTVYYSHGLSIPQAMHIEALKLVKSCWRNKLTLFRRTGNSFQWKILKQERKRFIFSWNSPKLCWFFWPLIAWKLNFAFLRTERNSIISALRPSGQDFNCLKWLLNTG